MPTTLRILYCCATIVLHRGAQGPQLSSLDEIRANALAVLSFASTSRAYSEQVGWNLHVAGQYGDKTALYTRIRSIANVFMEIIITVTIILLG